MMGFVPPARLVSLGYEGRTADELVSAAQPANVTVLVDVRQIPLSRKPGLSKRALAASLADVGIAYVNLRALGNAKENRVPFREGQPSGHRLFRSILVAEDGAAAIQLRQGIRHRGRYRHHGLRSAITAITAITATTANHCHRAVIYPSGLAMTGHRSRSEPQQPNATTARLVGLGRSPDSV